MIVRQETRLAQEAVVEEHRQYVDVQAMLLGEEIIDWFPTDSLTVDTPYDESKDDELYKRPHPGSVPVSLRPGDFVVLFPQDAHMPCLRIGDTPEPVTKVVVKIKAELLMPLR